MRNFTSRMLIILVTTCGFGLAVAPGALAATTTPSTVTPLDSPPAGWIWPGAFVGNELDCEVKGAAGLVTFQWEAYRCYQSDWNPNLWELWVHPW